MSTLATQTLAATRLIDDWSKFSTYPEPVQDDVLRKLKWIAAITQAGHGKKDGIKEQAAKELKNPLVRSIDTSAGSKMEDGKTSSTSAMPA